MQHNEETLGVGEAREGLICLLGRERFEFNPANPEPQQVLYRGAVIGWVTVRRDHGFDAVSSRGEAIGRHNTIDSAVRAMIEARAL